MNSEALSPDYKLPPLEVILKNHAGSISRAAHKYAAMYPAHDVEDMESIIQIGIWEHLAKTDWTKFPCPEGALVKSVQTWIKWIAMGEGCRKSSGLRRLNRDPHRMVLAAAESVDMSLEGDIERAAQEYNVQPRAITLVITGYAEVSTCGSEYGAIYDTLPARTSHPDKLVDAKKEALRLWSRCSNIEDKYIIKMMYEGWMKSEIALDLGITRQHVDIILWRIKGAHAHTENPRKTTVARQAKLHRRLSAAGLLPLKLMRDPSWNTIPVTGKA